MILYCAADPNYFNNYFELWATQCHKYYPNMKKLIALYNPSNETFTKCQQYGIEYTTAFLPENPERRYYYLLRWLNLPYKQNELILETQINCLPVKTQIFKDDNEGVEHLRISRYKGKRVGGVSAAVFKPDAAKKIVEQARTMILNPPDDDHEMNIWQQNNLSWKTIITEQQFKSTEKIIGEDTCWITAGTSKRFSVNEKLIILKHYTYKNE
jgi:hypothetical protein